jgi:hypothetical protein
MIKTKQKFITKLYERVRDKTKPVLTDDYGRLLIPTKWVEAKELNLGSIRKPNKRIFEVRIEQIPIVNTDMRDDEFFRGHKHFRR